MLFNSVPFLVFFLVVSASYFICPARWRWALLLVASYFFYCQWGLEYALLIVVSTAIDYVAAAMMKGKKTKNERRPWLYASIAGNLGLLFFFKYYDWFNANLTAAAGAQILPFSHVLLPVGISFYTLQSLGYTIDVYRGRIEPEEEIGIFATYVAYFPQLVAGPIERAKNLIPQLTAARGFDPRWVSSGLKLMAWGMFKKVCVADRLGPYTRAAFEGDPVSFTGPVYAVATILFCLQVYCDFSAYSDIAIGAAEVMGVRLTENFRRPFFARNIQELWGRWHITLVGWLQDYIYQPLAHASRRATTFRKQLNILIVFLVTGLWHGADWKFVAWGGVNGLFVMGHVSSLRLRRRLLDACGADRVPRVHAVVSALFTFSLFCLGSVFFAAKDLEAALAIYARLPTGWYDLSAVPRALLSEGPMNLLLCSVGVAVLLAGDALQEWTGSVRGWLSARSPWLRWSLYYGLILWIVLFGVFEREEFVYFQF